MRLKLTQQITLEGFTYPPGEWEVVAGNDAGPAQIIERLAVKMLEDYTGVVSEVKEQAAQEDVDGDQQRVLHPGRTKKSARH